MPNEIKMGKAEIDAMLAELVGELNDMVKAERPALLAKGIEDAPEEDSEGSSGPAVPPEAADDSAPADDAAAAPDMGDAGIGDDADAAPADEASAPDDGMAPEAPGDGQAEAIEPAASAEELHAEYSKLPDDELKNHYLACKAALFDRMGGDEEPAAAPADAPAAPAPAPDMGAAPPAPPAPAPEASAPPAMKSEESLELAALRKSVKDQDEALGKLVEVLSGKGLPMRKAVTKMSDLEFVGKNAVAEKPAVTDRATATKILNEKIREGKLTKSDKEVAMSFAVGGIGLDKIQHLLVRA